MRTLTRIRLALAYPSLTRLAQDASVLTRAYACVRYYYLFFPVMAFLFMQTWTVPIVQQNYAPLWPLAWTHSFALTPDATVILVRALLIVMALVGATAYRSRLVRIGVFIAVWQAHAFMSSFGQMDHQWYPWLYTSFIFIFLPLGDDARTGREYLLVVWWAQASFMLLYSMAGFWKFFAAAHQLLLGQVNGFSQIAFAYQIANWLPKLQHEALLGPFFITHPAIGWPLYVAAQFFQLFALWTMVRPSLQRLWAYELVVFHFMTYLTMGIDFLPFIPLLLILFFDSPFAPRHVTFGQMARDLPFLGWFIGRFMRSAL